MSLPPASSSSTRLFGSALSRLASTQPAEPAPTMTKSASAVVATCIPPNVVRTGHDGAKRPPRPGASPEPKQGQGLCPRPPKGRCPLDPRQGRALGTRPLVGLREGRSGWPGLPRFKPAIAGFNRDSPGQTWNAPPSTQPNEWIPKAPPLVGVQGAKPPGGFQGRALTFRRFTRSPQRPRHSCRSPACPK